MDEREERRLAAVRALAILDTEVEAVFDEAVLLASTICGTPISLVSIVDEKRQWFKARIGTELTETPREQAFCAHAIQQDNLFVIGDAQLDARFQDNPLVTGYPGIRFYAGFPLLSGEQCPVGTLCVIDTKPRVLTKEQTAALAILGRQLTAHLRIRARMKTLNQAVADYDLLEQRISSNNALFRAFMDNSPLLGFIKDEDGKMLYYNRPFAEHFHITATAWIDKTDFDVYPRELAAKYRVDDLAALDAGEPVVREQSSAGEDSVTCPRQSNPV